MNRLEAMIARLLTQRAALDAAARLAAPLDGPVLEIGLGKGRTYSHLRGLFPDREIYAFDKELHAPPDASPPEGCLRLGDFRETLAAMAKDMAKGRIGPAALAHADIGSEDREKDAALARDISGPIIALMANGGLVLGDRALSHPRLREIDGPKVDPPRHCAMALFHLSRGRGVTSAAVAQGRFPRRPSAPTAADRMAGQ